MASVGCASIYTDPFSFRLCWMAATTSLGLGVIHYLSFQESSLLLLKKCPEPTGVTLMVEFGGRVTPKCPWTDSLLEQPNPL